MVDGLKYQKSHEYVKMDGDVATVGISDFAQVGLLYSLGGGSVVLVVLTGKNCDAERIGGCGVRGVARSWK